MKYSYFLCFNYMPLFLMKFRLFIFVGFIVLLCVIVSVIF